MKGFLLQDAHARFTGDRLTEIKNSTPTGPVIKEAQPLGDTEYYAKMTESNTGLASRISAKHHDVGLEGDEINSIPPNITLNRNPKMPLFRTHDGVSFYQLFDKTDADKDGVYAMDGIKVTRTLDSDKSFAMCLKAPIDITVLTTMEDLLSKFVAMELDNLNFVYKKKDELLILKQLEVLANFSAGGHFMKDNACVSLFSGLLRALANVSFGSVQFDKDFLATTEAVKSLYNSKRHVRRIALDPRNPSFTVPLGDPVLPDAHPSLTDVSTVTDLTKHLLGLPEPDKGFELVKVGENSYTQVPKKPLAGQV